MKRLKLTLLEMKRLKLTLLGLAALTCLISGIAAGAPLTGLLAAVMVAAGAYPVSQCLAAKSGTIIDDTDLVGTDINVRAVADSEPLIATLGALAVTANRATQVQVLSVAKITNNLALRRLFVMPTDATADYLAGLNGAVGSFAGMVKSAELTFDDDSAGPAAMSNTVANGTGLSTAINAAIATAKPSLSMSAIINKVEDIVIDTGGATDAIVLVDQAGEKAFVYTGTPAQVTAAHDEVLTLGAPLAAFLQDATPTAASEKQFGE